MLQEVTTGSSSMVKVYYTEEQTDLQLELELERGDEVKVRKRLLIRERPLTMAGGTKISGKIYPVNLAIPLKRGYVIAGICLKK